MTLRLCLGALVLCHHFHATAASACGATPFMLSPLLPPENAASVALDAALIATTNGGRITFELRQVNEPGVSTEPGDNLQPEGGLDEGDAGVPAVELSVTCWGIERGSNLCAATPVSLLEPNAEYEWSAYVPASLADPSAARPHEWHRFTTASAASGPAVIELRSEVLSNEKKAYYVPCGGDHSVILGVTARSPVQSLVVHASDITSTHLLALAVLEADNPSVWLSLFGSDCVRLGAVDATGKRTELEAICPEEVLPVTYRDSAGNVVSPPPSPSEPMPSSKPADVTTDARETEESDVDEHLGRRAIQNDGDGGCALWAPAERSYRGWLLAAGFLAVLVTRLRLWRS